MEKREKCFYCGGELNEDEIEYYEQIDDNFDEIIIPCCEKCFNKCWELD